MKEKKYAVTFTVRPTIYVELTGKADRHYVVLCEDENQQKCVWGYAAHIARFAHVKKNNCGRYHKGAMQMTADEFFSLV